MDRDIRESGEVREGNALLDGISFLWGLPNEVIGQGFGYLGYGVGHLAHALGAQKMAPRIVRDRERRMTNFLNSPFTPIGALTIGHATQYDGDPYDLSQWPNFPVRSELFDHEASHSVQSDTLGPFYLPSNLLGGAAGILLDRDWHSPANWNERGPQMKPSRPWPARER